MDVRKHARGTSTSSSSQQPDWSGRLDGNILQLISSKLDSPCVPGALHLSSICRAWRASAGVPVEALTWHSCQPSSDTEQELRVQLVQRSFKPWLLKAAPQLDSFVLVCNQAHAETRQVWAVLEEAACAAAAAGSPLPLQQLQLPLDDISLWSKPAAALVSALPRLRSLSVALVGYSKQDAAAFRKALGGLSHLTSLEVGLFGALTTCSWSRSDENWEALLEAAPKQLQRLAVRVGPGEGESYTLGPRYTWAPLAAFPHLKQLQLGAAHEEDLSPLAALPSLTSLGLQWEGQDWQPLVAVKGLLRELEVADVLPCNQEHLEQLTLLTSLTLREEDNPSRIPQQVASGLQRLDWGLRPDDLSSGGYSTRTDLLGHCSSSNLRDLRLHGRPWFPDWLASQAVQRLTRLTSFGLLAQWPLRAAPTQVSLSRWSQAIQCLKQLRRLEVSAPLLATPTAWLGALPHLTSLRLAVDWPVGWPVEDSVRAVVASPAALSNLHSCKAGLQVLEMHLATYIRADVILGDDPSEVVPLVRQLLQPEVPGVQLLVTWEESEEPVRDEEWSDGYDSYGTASDSGCW